MDPAWSSYSQHTHLHPCNVGRVMIVMCQAPKAAVEALPPKESNGVQRNGDAMTEGQDSRDQWGHCMIGETHGHCRNHKHSLGSRFLAVPMKGHTHSFSAVAGSKCIQAHLHLRAVETERLGTILLLSTEPLEQCRWLPSKLHGPHFPSSTLSRGWSWTQSQPVEHKTRKTRHLASSTAESDGTKKSTVKFGQVPSWWQWQVSQVQGGHGLLANERQQPLEWRPFGLSTQFLVPDLASSFNEGRSNQKISAGCNKSKANSLSQSYAVMPVVKWLAHSALQWVSLTKLKCEL